MSTENVDGLYNISSSTSCGSSQRLAKFSYIHFVECSLPDALAPETDVRVENNAADEDEIIVGQELRELQPMSQRQEPGELHPTLRREVYRLHRNLGHPNKQSFLRALRHAGVKEEVLAWVKSGFHCPLCERNQKSKPHRPGHLQKNMTFNQVVGIDLFKAHERLFLNCLCWGTDLQMVKEIPSKKPEDVLSAFYEVWMAHYGPPSLVVADQGKEFIGSEFADKIGEMGVPVHYIDVRSPWQNSRTERAGGIFKTIGNSFTWSNGFYAMGVYLSSVWVCDSTQQILSP